MEALDLRPPADWAAKLVGAPNVAGGEDPAGWDCWGLTRWVCESIFGWNLPVFPCDDDRQAATTDAEFRRGLFARGVAGYWRPLDTTRPRQPAAVLMTRGRNAPHCGVTDGRGYLLHVTGPSGTVYVPLDHPRVPKVMGFYVPR
jgi:cell wall-associated NlpC family hydrolase